MMINENIKEITMISNKKNLVSSIIVQVVTIISGLVVPRLIISTFGSGINGLVSSITQFLSFISLFEGGVGAVVLVSLYKPIENRDFDSIGNIVFECDAFFKKLSIGFIIYTAVLMVMYPMLASDYSFIFTGTLILVLSVTIFVQYMFSIKYKLFLQANQKLYIVNTITSLSLVINIVFTFIVIKVFPSIHLVKLFASLIFLFQVIAYRTYVARNEELYSENKTRDGRFIADKKSAFGQNLAHFINMNSDVIVLTLFATLADVSVYTVYMLVFTALRNLFASGINSYQTLFGKYLASNEQENLKKSFYKCRDNFLYISIAVFATTLLLINQFVKLYTTSVVDANYYQPTFALFMCIAQFIYILREPYRVLVLAAGKFKETNIGSYLEAILNLSISILLVRKFGLIGVALGTFVAILYRYAYLLIYIHKEIIHTKFMDSIVEIFISIIIFGVNIFLYKLNFITIDSFVAFAVWGTVVFSINLLCSFVLNRIMNAVKNRKW